MRANGYMHDRILMLCGVLAPITYAVTVVLGGLLRPEYSHAANAVSDLIATAAPNKALLDSLFAAYNLLTIAFGAGLLQRVRREGRTPGTTAGRLGALFLLAEGILGVATLFFPEPPGGTAAPITPGGTLHIVLAGLSSLATMLAMLLVGVWFRKNPGLRRYGMYSIISVIAVLLSGGLAAVGVANHSPVAGLMERITIGAFLQWMFVVALKMPV